MKRRAARAGLFYPRDAATCREQLAECLGGSLREGRASGDPVAAILPHAGWVYSGRVAAGALQALAARRAPTDLVVLFGAVHVPGVERATVTAASAWETPLGDMEVDQQARRCLPDRVLVSDTAHRGEHSLEVELPFVQELFPGASILPIAVPADQDAAEFGRQVAEALADLGDRVVYLGSTDMSHYGYRFGFVEAGTGAPALRWVKQENDARMIALMEDMQEDRVVAEAERNWNACGAGAIAATMAAARARGKQRGVRTGYTTSADVLGEREPGDFVGYCGMVY